MAKLTIRMERELAEPGVDDLVDNLNQMGWKVEVIELQLHPEEVEPRRVRLERRAAIEAAAKRERELLAAELEDPNKQYL